ncbi:MAG: hypothetical protein OXI87_16960 [Albidovulum sp.]|nr:hypothetical protein [Albidovulum sp.]MDE0306546.1 hypothetical protein [Albidovulum sp.]MDE0531194.1 hypothetical protein [Albidovulum sp.]
MATAIGLFITLSDVVGNFLRQREYARMLGLAIFLLETAGLSRVPVDRFFQ